MVKEILEDHKEEVKSFFGMGYDQFRTKVIASFKAMKNDVLKMKDNVADWIMFLDANQRDLQKRVAELESKIAMLELNKKIGEKRSSLIVRR